MNRRTFLGMGTLAAGWALLPARSMFGRTPQVTLAGYPFKQAPLPYGYADLEPVIDAQTMELHYASHHSGYVAKLNEALASEPALQGQTLEQLFMQLPTLKAGVQDAIRNHGGGHWNHTFFWQCLAPEGKTGVPTGGLLQAMSQDLGGPQAVMKLMEQRALAVFGSGWVWLVKDAGGRLAITTTANQENPLMAPQPVKPLLGIDVWEHAYYLKHQNRRADYLRDIWARVNWNFVAQNWGQP